MQISSCQNGPKQKGYKKAKTSQQKKKPATAAATHINHTKCFGCFQANYVVMRLEKEKKRE